MMTREEAIELLKDLNNHVPKYDDAINMAIEALEQPQREQAIKDCRNCKNGRYNDHYGIRFCYESDDCVDWNLWEPKDIEPERKTGKWRHYEGMYTCSECGASFYDISPWCPMCGADMRGKDNG